MRTFFVRLIIVCAILLIGCIKDSSKEKTTSTPSSIMSSRASITQEPMYTSLEPTEGTQTLQGVVQSDGSYSISSKAFTEACPAAIDLLQSDKRCLYYAKNNDIYQMCFPERSVRLMYSIPKEQMPEGNIRESIKIASGRMIWKSRLNLFMWDGAKVYSIPLVKNPYTSNFDNNYEVTSYLISPNGQCIAWNTNRVSEYETKNDDPTFSPDSLLKTNIVYVARLGSRNRQEVFREVFGVYGINADHNEEKRLLAWSKRDPSIIFLTTQFDMQLYSGFKSVKAVDFKSSSIKYVSEKAEHFLTLSPDERKVAYTQNTDCGIGSNCANDTVIISGSSSDNNDITIYDEWKEFGNKGKEDEMEYVPIASAFSPSGSLIAISISGPKRLATIRKVDGNGSPGNLTDRFVIGWLNENALVIGTGMNDYRRTNIMQDIFIYDLKSNKEESLSLKNIIYLNFE